MSAQHNLVAPTAFMLDDFVSFVAEELTKEGFYALVVEAPNPNTNEKLWLVGPKNTETGKEALVSGLSLFKCLNSISLDCGFTKRLLEQIVEAASLTEKVALLASSHGSDIVVSAPSGPSSLWTVTSRTYASSGVAVTLALHDHLAELSN